MRDARVFVTRTSGRHSTSEQYHPRKPLVSEQTALGWSRHRSEVPIPSLPDPAAPKIWLTLYVGVRVLGWFRRSVLHAVFQGTNALANSLAEFG
jgi:hypothetical protein